MEAWRRASSSEPFYGSSNQASRPWFGRRGIVLQRGKIRQSNCWEQLPSVLAVLGVRLACVLLDHVADEDDRVLTSSRFQHLANLSYLVSSQEQFPTALPPSPLEFEALPP